MNRPSKHAPIPMKPESAKPDKPESAKPDKPESAKPDGDSDRLQVEAADTDAIPLLTERLYVPTLPPVVSEDADAAPANPPAPASAAPAASATPEPSAPPPAPAAPVVDISEVRDTLLQDLERTLPGQIDSMIRREVSNAIDDAVFRVVAETQDALARAIGQVVERAVKEELDRLRKEAG
jgi:hypothetical protein